MYGNVKLMLQEFIHKKKRTHFSLLLSKNTAIPYSLSKITALFFSQACIRIHTITKNTVQIQQRGNMEGIKIYFMNSDSHKSNGSSADRKRKKACYLLNSRAASKVSRTNSRTASRTALTVLCTIHAQP
jgi:hypothetical protein